MVLYHRIPEAGTISDDLGMTQARIRRTSVRTGASAANRALGKPRAAWRKALPSAQTAVVLVLTLAALIFGGGGSPAPRPELLVQLVAAAACIAWVLLPATDSAGNPVPASATPLDRRLLAMAGLVLAVPALQLVPLPPALWQALPGRELEVQALALVGAANSWMPWTISPARTLASLLAMLPPVVAMLMVSRLDESGRRTCILAIAALGLVSVGIGTLQLAAGPADWVTFYPDSAGRVFGFQANRNAEVDVLLIALVAGAAVFATWQRRNITALIALAAFCLIMVLGAALTASRAGIALVPIAVLFSALILYQRGMAARRIGLWLAGSFIAVVVAGALLRGNGAIDRVLTRFTSGEDFRAELWTDAWYAIGQYWPLGSGTGTVVPVLIGVERLEVVDVTVPNRVHNDFLELALEAGVPGVLALTATLVLLGMIAWRAWRGRSAANRPQILFAGATLIIIALHSVVDYPLRSMALAHLAGVAAGLLVPVSRAASATGRLRESQA